MVQATEVSIERGVRTVKRLHPKTWVDIVWNSLCRTNSIDTDKFAGIVHRVIWY